jgi:hypothetical protein
MTALKPNSLIISIIIYIVSTKLFESLFSISQFINMKNDFSELIFYIFSIFYIIVTVIFMQFCYVLYNKNLNKENFIYLYIISLLVVFIITSYLSYYYGKETGSLDVKFDKFAFYINTNTYAYLIFHGIIFTLYRFIFKYKKSFTS